MLREHRYINYFYKYTLLIGVFALSAFLGSIWLGWNMTLWILGIGALISLISTNIAPAKILKWQGAAKMDRYYYSELYHMVNDLALKAGLHYSPDIYMVKSTVPNAFALGTKNSPIIGMTTGLVSTLNQRELKGVIAHEISHIKNNDLFIKGIAMSFGNLTNTLSMIGKFLLIFSLPLYVFDAITLPLLPLLLLVFSPTLNVLLQLGISRSMEFLADYDAATITKDPMGLASALQRIDNISKPWWMSLSPAYYKNTKDWLSSHPNTRVRIEKLSAMGQHYNEKYRNKPKYAVPSIFLHKNPFYHI